MNKWEQYMKKTLIIILPCVLFLAGTAVTPIFSHAAITSLPWSSSAKCTSGDWLYGNNCEGVEAAGSQSCAAGRPDQVTPDANNPAGGGGNGWRHYIGDGQNINGQGFNLAFSPGARPTEFYFRWYMRYPAGFAWSGTLGYQKLIYTDPHSAVLDFKSPEGVGDGNGWQFYSQRVGIGYEATGNGWYTTQAGGGRVATGAWHWYEVHMKVDTNGLNGVLEVWADGVKAVSRSDVSYGAPGTPFSRFGLLTNQNAPSNGACVPVDIDDLALSTTGPIGPITGSNPPPAAPSNLKVQ